ncbi:MAG: PIN domain-containing protein [Microcoleaceae cyanobacterium MO_207.B10]|nr:PIN domain-containing protein [Microcoleaceae cyanobacterium MO_207.B10]
MIDYIRKLFGKYKRKGVIVDTNILLLLFVGSVNKKRISKFNRTEQFSPKDYDFLVEIISYFSKIVVTPNILTEVSNFINQLTEPERSQCLEFLAKALTQWDEFYVESSTATQVEKFTKYGLTDSGIISLAKEKYLVLTDDFKLANYLEKIEIDTVNFNHIRVSGWKEN